jgi:hypothetical protein
MKNLDNDGEETGKEFSPSNHTLAVTAARDFTGKLKAGTTLKIPSEYLGGFEGSQWAIGWAIDMGVQYQPDTKQFLFGASILNLGRKEVAHTRDGQTGGMIPLEIRGGMVFHSLSMPKSRIVVDVCVPYHNYPYLAGGIEHQIKNSLTLRAGTRFNLPEAQTAFRNFILSQDTDENTARNALKLAGGFSFFMDFLTLDYAAQYWHLLGIVHYVTFKWKV